MAGFLTRLLARLRGNNQSRRLNRNGRRKLRVEQMEFRRLLAGDIGSIAGNLYIDLTDNGFDLADDAAANVTVYLYRDGGNSTYESSGGVASGDDVFVTSVTSDSNGDYRFGDLIAGTYFVEQAPATGLLQRATETPKTVVLTETQAAGVETLLIDDYNSTTQTVTAVQGATASDSISTAVNEAVGDERDILVTNSGLAGAGDLVASISSGVVAIAADPGAQGSVILSYDGVDTDATTLDHTNLNLNLSASGATSFQILASSEAGNTLTVDVYSGATNFSRRTVALPVTGSLLTLENLNIDFADFTVQGGTGANFGAVTAIRFEVAVAESVDARIDFSRVVAPFVSDQDIQNLNPMTLGDRVFNDSNNNGVLDTGETGISGVTLELYADTNGNGVFNAGTDVLLDTTTTNGTGVYSFTDLFPGNYFVLIPLSEFATNADPLFGFQTSTGNDPAPDPDSDTNSDDNGTFLGGVGVISAAITLASGAEPTNDNDTDTDSNLSLDFGFVPEVDIAVTKTSDTATKIAGTNVTYTIVVSNEGDNTATNVVVVDDLPNFMTIVSAISTGGGVVTQPVNPNGEVQVVYSSLTAGQTATITIVASIPAAQAAATTVTNTATVTSDGIETDTNNNTDTADIAITREAVLTLTKSDTPDPIGVGQNLTYTIVVTNTGASTATNVVVTDTLPTGLTFVSVNPTVGTAVEASGVITATIPTLAVGASATITIVATIQAGFSGTTIANTASADADESAVVTANASTTVNPSVDLAIVKTDSADPVNRGSQLTYTLTIVNNGPSAATNVAIVDTLPAGVQFVSATGGTVTAPSGGGSDVIIAVGNLASGATATATVVVNVLQSAAASLSNTAIVRSTESLAGFDSNTANNTDTETTATQGTIDLAITKADSADPVTPGESFTYTLVVTNNGPSDATGVVVTDNLPDGLRITSATSTVGTVTIPASAQDTTAANNDDLTVAVGALANGATATITIVAAVLPDFRGTAGSISNTATVSSTTTTLIESNTANNTDTEATALTPEVDVRITKTDSTDPIVAGNSLTYQIVVTNDGPSTATNVVVSDTLPTGVTFTSVTTTQGTATQASGVITGTIGTLAPGASATLTLIVGVNGTTRGTLANTATVTSTETDVDPADNTATASTTVNATTDLAITKTDSTDPVQPGSTLTYTIVVTNNGPSTATNVVVTDNLATTGVTFVSGTSTVGTVTNASNVVTANVGTLASGASATITLTTTVPSTRTTALTNVATVTGTETDSVTTNNSATQATALVVPGSISGNVYIDSNRSGVRDTGEAGIAGVTVTLTGTDTNGAAVNRTATTDSSGNYTFSNVLPGTYTLTQTQPANFNNGASNPGTGTTGTGTAGTNTISTITLASGENGTVFNFGEQLAVFSKRRFLASTTPSTL